MAFGLITLITLGANLLGLDLGSGWGLFRKTLFSIGLGGMMLSVAGLGIEEIEQKILHQRMAQIAAANQAGATPKKIPAWLMVIYFIVIGALYLGLITVWKWTEWQSSTAYYSMLGEAFLQGKTWLPIEPSPLLAKMENPYSFAARQGIPTVRDLSYFNNKYYMYWGPAPTLIANLGAFLTRQVVSDDQIVLFSVSLLSIMMLLILRYLHKKHLPGIPTWLYGAGILVASTFHPLLWVLNSPDIYSAAISSGQAFLMTGLFFAFPVLDGTQSKVWRLILVGSFWVLAVASRLTLVLPVAVLLVGILIRWIQQARTAKNWALLVPRLAAVGLPMLAGMLLLGLYNYTRFGNFLDTGVNYALSPNDLLTNTPAGLVFNIRYTPANLLYHFFTPLRFLSTFPFIKPYFTELPIFTALLASFNVPYNHEIENSAGLLFSMPILLFAGLFMVRLITGTGVPRRGNNTAVDGKDVAMTSSNLQFTLVVLMLAGLAASATILVYFYVTARYLFDFMPLMVILAVASMWLEYTRYRSYPVRRRVVIVVIVALVIATMLVSFLLALTGAQSRFDDFNPMLFNVLVEFFR